MYIVNTRYFLLVSSRGFSYFGAFTFLRLSAPLGGTGINAPRANEDRPPSDALVILFDELVPLLVEDVDDIVVCIESEFLVWKLLRQFGLQIRETAQPPHLFDEFRIVLRKQPHLIIRALAAALQEPFAVAKCFPVQLNEAVILDDKDRPYYEQKLAA
ncbi:hypothetical protein [Burkholderia multivorans]|uniref:hypothetical protein n=1 Tax=Burkholderia multivorans TaxID=87883 RepID=UPI0011B27586|nr:hypothetical protein [Burkholderia multivorans]